MFNRMFCSIVYKVGKLLSNTWRERSLVVKSAPFFRFAINDIKPWEINDVWQTKRN